MKYRKKPVIVEAWQNVESDPTPPWVSKISVRQPNGWRKVFIPFYAWSIAEPNDWIIRDSNGAVTVCKPDVFAETYEPVEEQ